jgi:hypothetical protein
MSDVPFLLWNVLLCTEWDFPLEEMITDSQPIGYSATFPAWSCVLLLSVLSLCPPSLLLALFIPPRLPGDVTRTMTNADWFGHGPIGLSLPSVMGLYHQ